MKRIFPLIIVLMSVFIFISDNLYAQNIDWGISIGVGYFFCRSQNDDYATAHVGQSNEVVVDSELDDVNRIFPTATLYIVPAKNKFNNLYFGPTLVVNNGANNDDGGFSGGFGLNIGLMTARLLLDYLEDVFMMHL
jgi:hypothetical protein